MIKKIGIMLIAVIGLALVLFGHETVSRGFSALGHLLIIAALLLGVWNNKREARKNTESEKGKRNGKAKE